MRTTSRHYAGTGALEVCTSWTASSSATSDIGDVAAVYVRFALEHPTASRLMFDRALCHAAGEPDELEPAGAWARGALREFIERRYACPAELADKATFAAWSQMHGVATVALETPALKGLAPERAIELARRNSTYARPPQPPEQ